MAICIPPVDRATSDSAAELKLFAALAAQLDDDYLVMHSVAWISKPAGNGPRDGEVDFLICHPRKGILVLEAKGGRVALDYSGKSWTSTDRSGKVHDIHNPFEQAKRGKYGVLEKLLENPHWIKLNPGRVTLGHAVFLPDVSDGSRLKGPDAPPEIIGDRNDLGTLRAWIDRAFTYWSVQEPAGQIGSPGLEAVRRIFARVVSTRPLLSARLADEESERITLTSRQATVLDFLTRQRRVMVVGGAGTGKTLIAREKAVRTAGDGLSTLLMCYNRGLADHLREQCRGIPGLEVATFHQLCRKWIDKAKTELGRDLIAEARRDYPGKDEFDHYQPIALAVALDILSPRYDAIVIDEGQDFGDEFWMPVEMLLSDHEKALLYVFLDENQDIYRRSAAIPVQGEPMVLDRNCRNTNRIHAAAYRYYRGGQIEAPPIAGAAVELLPAGDLEKQARAIAGLVTRLVSEDKVAPHDIGVLICDGRLTEQCRRALAAHPVPATMKWAPLEGYGSGSVTLDTVAKFKGLERSIIILWGLDNCSPTLDRGTLYVGMSRAKSVLYLCGERQACDSLIDPTTNG